MITEGLGEEGCRWQRHLAGPSSITATSTSAAAATPGQATLCCQLSVRHYNLLCTLVRNTARHSPASLQSVRARVQRQAWLLPLAPPLARAPPAAGRCYKLSGCRRQRLCRGAFALEGQPVDLVVVVHEVRLQARLDVLCGTDRRDNERGSVSGGASAEQGCRECMPTGGISLLTSACCCCCDTGAAAALRTSSTCESVEPEPEVHDQSSAGSHTSVREQGIKGKKGKLTSVSSSQSRRLPSGNTRCFTPARTGQQKHGRRYVCMGLGILEQKTQARGPSRHARRFSLQILKKKPGTPESRIGRVVAAVMAHRACGELASRSTRKRTTGAPAATLSSLFSGGYKPPLWHTHQHAGLLSPTRQPQQAPSTHAHGVCFLSVFRSFT